MKKIYTIIALAGSTMMVSASEPVTSGAIKNKMYGDGGSCFDGSSHIINVGVGLGFGGRYYSAYRGSGYTFRRSPSFSLSYEQPLKDKLGPGYLGVGAYAGYQTAYSRYDYRYNNGNNHYYYDNRWSNFVIAARAAYHLDELNTENAELYFGAMAGLRFQTYRYETNDPNPNKGYYYSGGSAFFASSVFIGGRWYFAKSVALFGELGYGISYGTIGLSFKF
jgi:hypothetical protein